MFQIAIVIPFLVADISFKTDEVDKSLDIGYAVTTADIDGDGKKDIVVVDSERVIWLQNPTWKLRTILKGVTKPHNVCIETHDIDGDGQVDVVIGAEWKPFNTKSGGTIQWLKRGKNIDDNWTVYPIDEEPTVHRIRFADINGDGKPELVSGPLMGRGSSKDNNWTDGSPVRVTAYHIPKDPTKDRWTPQVLDESLHVIHNLWPIDWPGVKGKAILTASYEGVNLILPGEKKSERLHLGAGNQDNPKSNRGASEIKMGKLKSGKRFIATVEPWHGNQIVVYSEPADATKMWNRHVIDDQLRWGHAVWTADLDGDGGDELIIGVRDDPLPKDTFKERRGIRVYKSLNGEGAKWDRQIVDNGGMACEDLTVLDLNGDGRPDIIACGRQTKNVRIYWNQK